MNEKEIIIKLMEEQGLSAADLASQMGISNAALWDRIKSPKNKSLTTKKLNEILKQLNYEIVLMPRAKASKISGAYVVTTEGSETK